eukprot:TRINITY_DN34418_c0_g1_i1.p1 TRINITY_DN34418_c0_g1~~TRINITY_DN34418_c0_g1_i1.p1  ORF type:complete len:339 (+),score=48.16 TRINITY_DN34418_c0_g1_i1:76-1092(+)
MSVSESILDGVVASANAAGGFRHSGRSLAGALESRQRTLEYKALKIHESICEISSYLGSMDSKRMSPPRGRSNLKMSPPAPLESSQLTTSILDPPSRGVQEILKRVNNTCTRTPPVPKPSSFSQQRPVSQYVDSSRFDQTDLKKEVPTTRVESPPPQRSESPQWSSRGRCRPFINTSSNPAIPVPIASYDQGGRSTSVRKLQATPPKKVVPPSSSRYAQPQPGYYKEKDVKAESSQSSASRSSKSSRKPPQPVATPLPPSPVVVAQEQYSASGRASTSSSSSSSLEPFPSAAPKSHKKPPDTDEANPVAHIPPESFIQNQPAHRTDSRNRGHDILPPP